MGKAVAAAAPDFAMAGVYLVTWISPFTLGRTMVKDLMFAMIVEFVAIHAANFLGRLVAARGGSLAGSLLVFAGLCGFYSIFAVALSYAYGGWWPFWAFYGMMANHLASIVLSGSHAEKKRVARAWGAAMAFFLAAVFLTTLLPMPTLGVTPEVKAAQHFTGSGLWIERPWKVLAAGFFYFFALGVYDFRRTASGGAKEQS